MRIGFAIETEVFLLLLSIVMLGPQVILVSRKRMYSCRHYCLSRDLVVRELNSHQPVSSLTAGLRPSSDRQTRKQAAQRSMKRLLDLRGEPKVTIDLDLGTSCADGPGGMKWGTIGGPTGVPPGVQSLS